MGIIYIYRVQKAEVHIYIYICISHVEESDGKENGP